LQRFKIFFLPPRCRAIFPIGCRGFTTDGGNFMKSLVIKRSVVVAGHKTSVSLEDAFWRGLKEIAHVRDLTLSELVGAIDSEREYGNLSSALRLFVLDFYRTQLSDLKEGRDGSDQGSETSGAVRMRRMAQARH
jgi:predicted DNA-binding ribbon-helix-helix protein